MHIYTSRLRPVADDLLRSLRDEAVRGGTRLRPSGRYNNNNNDNNDKNDNKTSNNNIIIISLIMLIIIMMLVIIHVNMSYM